MPSAPTSPLGATRGGMGWWKGQAHCPGHWLAELPTQMKGDSRRHSPWVPHRLMQKPSTVTSAEVRTTLMAAAPPPAFPASVTRSAELRDFPREHPPSSTWRPRKSTVFLPCP
ncbi:unnamed protein product [Spirodela intermedia]|uniref:Uncharacterized protein n=2 Tax=Spirodela intermedia TaxID=51605 RepID=A0A7I8KV13_SPIIN|nr:unnamed protein product [Spirodela intermedia]